MTIRAILWDFGGTLADESWMLAPMDGDEDWPGLYQEVLAADDLVRRWNEGDATTAEVVEALALRSGKGRGPIMAHMQSCCRRLKFNHRVLGLAAKGSLPQALVTVNSDIFTEVVASHYGLTKMFDVIVTSWQEGFSDKGLLCEIARMWLDPNLMPGECLLIDNIADNVAAWEARGGVGLHFTSEEALVDFWPF